MSWLKKAWTNTRNSATGLVREPAKTVSEGWRTATGQRAYKSYEKEQASSAQKQYDNAYEHNEEALRRRTDGKAGTQYSGYTTDQNGHVDTIMGIKAPKQATSADYQGTYMKGTPEMNTRVATLGRKDNTAAQKLAAGNYWQQQNSAMVNSANPMLANQQSQGSDAIGNMLVGNIGMDVQSNFEVDSTNANNYYNAHNKAVDLENSRRKYNVKRYADNIDSDYRRRQKMWNAWGNAHLGNEMRIQGGYRGDSPGQ